MVNLGTPEINFTFDIVTPQTTVVNNGVICLVAPFKDASFVYKYYDTIKQALDEQGGEQPAGALGYHYLEIISSVLGDRLPIACANITTGSDEVLNFDFSNTKLSNIFVALERANFDILCIPFEIDDDGLNVYKAFYEHELHKMKLFGLVVPRSPTTAATLPYSNIPPMFPKGGIYEVITTPVNVTLGLLDGTVFHASHLASLNVDVSPTQKSISEANISTFEEYGETVFETINNNGAVAVDILENNNLLYGIVNGNTPSMIDVSIIRTYNYIMKQIRSKLIFGEKNNKTTLANVLGAVNNVRSTSIDTGLCEDIELEIYKKTVDDNGSPVTNLMGATINVKIYDIVFKYDITSVLEVV